MSILSKPARSRQSQSNLENFFKDRLSKAFPNISDTPGAEDFARAFFYAGAAGAIDAIKKGKSLNSVVNEIEDYATDGKGIDDYE